MDHGFGRSSLGDFPIKDEELIHIRPSYLLHVPSDHTTMLSHNVIDLSAVSSVLDAGQGEVTLVPADLQNSQTIDFDLLHILQLQAS
jgi:hypothetical protein